MSPVLTLIRFQKAGVDVAIPERRPQECHKSSFRPLSHTSQTPELRFIGEFSDRASSNVASLAKCSSQNPVFHRPRKPQDFMGPGIVMEQ